jgi:hypothetical protein
MGAACDLGGVALPPAAAAARCSCRPLSGAAAPPEAWARTRSPPCQPAGARTGGLKAGSRAPGLWVLPIHPAQPDGASCAALPCLHPPLPPSRRSVQRIVGPKATGETCHIIIETNGDIPFWEGQSYGVIPPVGSPHLPTQRAALPPGGPASPHPASPRPAPASPLPQPTRTCSRGRRLPLPAPAGCMRPQSRARPQPTHRPAPLPPSVHRAPR